ncbi:unnamed protein product [Cuscuta europaea]|uniref:Uncharacterized protein n=1 Tax=Cuscuta europaea TaxID=41803 RepID=A0A9P0ZYH7_CUSEU|nr:unnamed protein product [Cuscuta europaea]
MQFCTIHEMANICTMHQDSNFKERSVQRYLELYCCTMWDGFQAIIHGLEVQSLIGPGPGLGPAGPSLVIQGSFRPNRSGPSKSESPGRPAVQPSREPAYQPSQQPAFQPTWEPAYQPSQQPAFQPTREPAFQLTREPAFQPSGESAFQPSQEPADHHPSWEPAVQPSWEPAVQPRWEPASSPTGSLPSSLPGSLPPARSEAFLQPSGKPTVQSSRGELKRPACQPG